MASAEQLPFHLVRMPHEQRNVAQKRKEDGMEMRPEAAIYKMTIEEAAQYSEEYCRLHFPLRYEKAMQFRIHEDRLRCIGAGALLYETLGLEDSDLRTGEHGKPLADSCDLHFNLSHSGEYIVLATARTPVGVDIERLDRKAGRGLAGLIRYVAAPEERDWIYQGADDHEQAKRFLQLWTMKESVVKALGDGLYRSFSSFNVLPLLRGEDMRLGSQMLCGRTEAKDQYALSVCIRTGEEFAR